MGLLDDLRNSIVNGDPEAARELTQKALQGGLTFEKIMSEALIPGIHEVGDKFGRGEMYLPELLVSAMAMKGAVEVLKPLRSDPGIKTAGKALIATVQGDLHDIGKNLVGMMLEGAGFEVIDLGIDIASEKVVKAAQDKQAQVGVPLFPVDHDHAGHEGGDSGNAEDGDPEEGESDGRRSPGHPGFRRRDRSGRVCAGCAVSGQESGGDISLE